jgi:hypothetical protein
MNQQEPASSDGGSPLPTPPRGICAHTRSSDATRESAITEACASYSGLLHALSPSDSQLPSGHTWAKCGCNLSVPPSVQLLCRQWRFSRSISLPCRRSISIWLTASVGAHSCSRSISLPCSWSCRIASYAANGVSASSWSAPYENHKHEVSVFFKKEGTINSGQQFFCLLSSISEQAGCAFFRVIYEVRDKLLSVPVCIYSNTGTGTLNNASPTLKC